MLDRKNLIRVIKITDNDFYIGNAKNIHGRSAYICRDEKCFARCKKIKGFEHSFKSNSASKIYKELENGFKKIL